MTFPYNFYTYKNNNLWKKKVDFHLKSKAELHFVAASVHLWKNCTAVEWSAFFTE